MPSGFGPDCAVAWIFGPAVLESNRNHAQNVLPCSVFGTKKISKLLLTASARSCYKERVQGTAMPINTAKRSKGQPVP